MVDRVLSFVARVFSVVSRVLLVCSLYLLAFSFFLLPPFSSAQKSALRTTCRKVVKFGTLIVDSVNTNHSKLGVSNSNSLAPSLVKSFTCVYANNF